MFLHSFFAAAHISLRVFLGVFLFFVATSCGDDAYNPEKEFEPRPYVYNIEKGKVFLDGEPLVSKGQDGVEQHFADPSTHSVIDARIGYSKDSGNVYFKTATIPAAEPESFKVLGSAPQILPSTSDEKTLRRKIYLKFYLSKKGGYVSEHPRYKTPKWKYTLNAWAIDTNKVFFNGTQVKNADPSTFEVLGGFMCHDAMVEAYVYAKDKNAVYLDAETVIPGADPASFSLVEGSCSFTKDKNKVYYKGKIVEGANPQYAEAFHPAAPYLRDRNTVYYKDWQLDGATVGSLEFYTNFPEYAHTEDKVYAYGKMVPLTNTQYDSAAVYTPVGSGYGYTKDRRFFLDQEILEPSYGRRLFLVDPEEDYAYIGDKLLSRGKDITPPGFRVEEGDTIVLRGYAGVNSYYYIKDGKVYLDDVELQGMEVGSLEKLPYGYLKDKARVYYATKLLQGANASEFRQIEHSEYFADKENVYLHGRRFYEAVGADFQRIEDSNCFSDNLNIFCQERMLDDVDVSTYQRVPEMEEDFKKWVRQAKSTGADIVQGRILGQPFSGRILKEKSFEVWADKNNIWVYIDGMKHEHLKFSGPPESVDDRHHWFVGRESNALFIEDGEIETFIMDGSILEVLPGNPYGSDSFGHFAFSGNTLYHKGKPVATLDREAIRPFPIDNRQMSPWNSWFFWDGQTIFRAGSWLYQLPQKCEIVWPINDKDNELLILGSKDGKNFYSISAQGYRLNVIELQDFDADKLRLAVNLYGSKDILVDDRHVYWNGVPLSGVRPDEVRIFEFGDGKGFVTENGIWTSEGRLYAYDTEYSEEIPIGKNGFVELEEFSDYRDVKGFTVFDGRFRLHLYTQNDISLRENNPDKAVEKGREWKLRVKPVPR